MSKVLSAVEYCLRDGLLAAGVKGFTVVYVRDPMPVFNTPQLPYVIVMYGKRSCHLLLDAEHIRFTLIARGIPLKQARYETDIHSVDLVAVCCGIVSFLVAEI